MSSPSDHDPLKAAAGEKAEARVVEKGDDKDESSRKESTEPKRRRWARALEERFPQAAEKVRAFLGSLPLPTTPRERRIFGALGIALALTLVLPFLLKPRDKPLFFGKADTELVIITPHNETIRREFTLAFQQWYQQKYGKSIHLDWRSPGGTSEIAKIISSEFHAAFQNHWKKANPGRYWRGQLGDSFIDPKYDVPPEHTDQLNADQEARRLFLQSNIGIGIDLFFGGGTYDFEKQRKAGTLAPADASGKFGLAALKAQQPDLFSETLIPQTVGGEPYYDPSLAWAGTCLSSFGIVYNRDALARLGLPPPTRWSDLGDPRFFGQIAVADPAKSGSIVKAFEMIVQQQIRETLDAAKPHIAATPPRLRATAEANAMREGWIKGLQLLQRIGANARYFTDSATKVPQDVAQGVAAAGMCIDYYGRTFNERLRRPDGTSRVEFVTPFGGTSTGVDSIAMLRGAPHPEEAHAFLEFIFSPEGQALWNNKPGSPNGPQHTALRRLPIRKDMYAPARLLYFSDPGVMPYDHANDFVYEPAWTAPRFDALRLGVRAMCIDTHAELTSTWKLLAEKNFPEAAMQQFGDMGQLGGDAEGVTSQLRSGDKLTQVKLARTLGAQFRRSYELARRSAKREQ